MSSAEEFEKLFLPSSRVIAAWDSSASGASLGTLIILLAECSLLCSICKADEFDIAVHGPSHGVTNLRPGEYRLLNENDKRDAALSLLENLQSLGRVFLCADLQAFDSLSSINSGVSLKWSFSGRADYDTTKYVNFFSAYLGFNANITFKPLVKNWVKRIFRNKFGNGRPTIGLHLKNISGADAAKNMSSAKQDVWQKFLLDATKKHRLNFVLLGDDSVSESIGSIANIYSAKEFGAINFGLQMAILSECSGFMGMMSSISNMAIFSTVPYAIFKNPEHHKNEMIAELGNGNSYSFANKYQKVIRAHETVNLLERELKDMPFMVGHLQ